jgi:hypothetical protein
MTHRTVLTLAAACAVLAAACTGQPGTPSGSAGAETCATTPAPPSSAIEAWSPAAQDPAIFPQIINPAGTLACGANRFLFSFLDKANVPIAAPDRTVTVAIYDLGAAPETPVATADATFIWAIEGSVGIYEANVALATAGLYGAEFRTKSPTSAAETIRVQFDVQPTSSVIAVGNPAPASRTLTLADVGGDVAKLSTDDQPVTAFYGTSVADAVAAKKPFLLVFATPKFCATAQCGPTLDRLKPIAARHPGLTVINVEPYELKSVDGQLQPVLTGDPAALTPVAAVNEWRLPAEPWVFVVDGRGIVTASFMLIFSDAELEAAIAAVE